MVRDHQSGFMLGLSVDGTIPMSCLLSNNRKDRQYFKVVMEHTAVLIMVMWYKIKIKKNSSSSSHSNLIINFPYLLYINILPLYFTQVFHSCNHIYFYSSFLTSQDRSFSLLLSDLNNYSQWLHSITYKRMYLLLRTSPVAQK